MSYLFLDELRVSSVLDQMRDMAVTQAMRREIRVHAERVAAGGEAFLDLSRPQPSTPFGDPHRWMLTKSEPGPNVDQVVLDGFSGPGHDGRDHASFRRGPSGTFPVADMQHPELAQFRCLRVAIPIHAVQLAGLGTAQPFSGCSCLLCDVARSG